MDPGTSPKDDPTLDPPRRIHLLGTGSIGKFVAHSLRSIQDPPPVTLLLHNLALISSWQSSSRELRIVHGEYTDAQSGFDWEPAIPQRRRYGKELDHHPEYKHKLSGEGRRPREDEESSEGSKDLIKKQEGNRTPIDHLIVAVKGPNTISALSTVRHRLTPDSTVLFLQNGMGIVEEVKKEIFPDPDEQPHFMQGIISHGVRGSAESQWEAVHTGFGTITLGMLPRRSLSSEAADDLPPTARYLFKTFTGIPALAAVGMSHTQLLQAQLEKLAINAVINPMTSLLDSRNGSVLYNFYLTRVQRLLIAEISLVLRSLPELQGLPNLETRFSPERLETLVVGVAGKTAQNISSMLADVRRGRETEIEYINGYIVRRGEEIGIKCLMNYLIMELVKGKTTVVSQEMRGYVPLILREMMENEKSSGQASQETSTSRENRT